MSRIAPAQTSFNGGEISKRLHARFDLAIYDIALAECEGWIPSSEGNLEACPGTLHVEQARGPCRLLAFEYSPTQGYVIEMSGGMARFYTNDARIEAGGVPVELAHPYSFEQVEQLTTEHSYDLLYLFHGSHHTHAMVRESADIFSLDTIAFENGPFEPRNKVEDLRVVASGVTGGVTLKAVRGGASTDLFAAGDVGGLFQIEADDFGDVRAWEPGITVAVNQLLTWNDRVYRVAGGSGRTGTLAPMHVEGVEWDGLGTGKDINGKDAGGVQLEYRHDRFGLLRITGFTSASEVSATVLRMLPITAAENYNDEGGYYDPENPYVPPTDGVAYGYGSWRWRFGAFSDRRGWPTAGVVWNERLILAKGSTLYGSVAGDLHNHASRNELGELSADMAFIYTIPDPSGIVGLIGQDKLVVLTRAGLFALGPSNAASGVGPGNILAVRQNSEGAAEACRYAEIDGRSVYIQKSRRRIIEADYTAQRDRREPIDLTRYARHIGARRFVDVVAQKDPNRLIWALCADGTLAAAAYVPEEQVLGWMRRPMAAGVLARSIAGISDPGGELGQLWIAAEYGGAWHVLRMAQIRQEDDPVDPAMLDLTFEYDGAPATQFGPVPLLAGAEVQVEADGIPYTGIIVGANGRFAVPRAAARVRAGLPFPARFRTLPLSSGGDNGPPMDKMKRDSRVSLDVLAARGLRVRIPGGRWQDLEQLQGDTPPDTAFDAYTGLVISEEVGDWTRRAALEVERLLPLAATVRAVQRTAEVSQR